MTDIVKFLLRIVSAVVLCFCFLQTSEAAQAAASGAMFPEVVARINDSPLSGRELETTIRRELAAIGSPEWKDLREEFRGELIYGVITALVNSRLIYDKAVASGIKVSDAEVDAEIQAIVKSAGGDAELNVALARQFMDRETLKQNQRRSLTISKYVESLVKDINVTQEELAKYYSEHTQDFAHPEIVRASHIMILGDENPDMDARAKERAEMVLAKAKKGEDFAKLAQEYSVHSNASAGGDLGFFTKNSVDDDFGQAIFSMKVNEIRLIKTRYGYHIVKLTDSKPEGVATLDEVKDELSNILKGNKAQAELNKVINQLREQAKIEVLIPYGQPLNP